MTSFLTLTFLLPAMAVCAQVAIPAPDNMVDMTHELQEGMPIWPDHPKYNFTILKRGYWKKGNSYVEANKIALSEHTGTHVDAPAHFAHGKFRIHQIPDRYWVAPGVVIDFREDGTANPDAELQVKDLEKYEEKYGRIPQRSLVLLNTGWGERWSNKSSFYGHVNGSRASHWPGFGLNATKWLVEERNIVGIGTDCLSFDIGNNNEFLVHRYLLQKNKIGYENVANLNRVPPAGTTVYGFPIKIHDGSGAPVRMYAMWNNAATGLHVSAIFLSFIFFLDLLLTQ